MILLLGMVFALGGVAKAQTYMDQWRNPPDAPTIKLNWTICVYLSNAYEDAQTNYARRQKDDFEVIQPIFEQCRKAMPAFKAVRP
jgi:hypothetical protein